MHTPHLRRAAALIEYNVCAIEDTIVGSRQGRDVGECVGSIARIADKCQAIGCTDGFRVEWVLLQAAAQAFIAHPV